MHLAIVLRWRPRGDEEQVHDSYPRSTPVDLEARRAETLQAMESVSRGEVVSGEAVHEWLRSWGASEELPVPKPGQ